jgi:hypothetical protein
MSSTGPAIRAVCRVINQSSCGSGSICGRWNGGSLILTNAHVAGTQIGRRVQVEIESLGMRRVTAEVIRAAYSTQVSADWALLFVSGFQEVAPVWLSKNPPASGESMYTKGFPACRAHNGTDIAQQQTLANGVLLWLPDAIGGQSGSGVWGDADNLQKALLTWSMQSGRRWYGAGQLTSEIYRQNRSAELRGYARMPGLVELPGYGDMDLTAVDRTGCDDPRVEEGFFSIAMERGIQDFPIWAEDQQPDQPPTDPGSPGIDWRARGIEALRKIRDQADDEIKMFEAGLSQPIKPNDGAISDTFGL